MSFIQNVNVHDANGNPITSYRNAMDTHDADVHREHVNKFFHSHGTSTTLSVDASAGDTSITVTSATGFSVGDFISVYDGNDENVFPRITAIATNTLTLNKPLDHSYVIGDNVDVVEIDMSSTAGSLASPISYKVQPLTGEVWHLTSVDIEMLQSSAGDLGSFGDITALSNGVVLRKYDGATTSFSSSTIWTNNADILLDTGDLKFLTASGSGSTDATVSNGNFSRAGGIIYLDGTAGDYLEMLIQDDLSGLIEFRGKVHGHFEGA